MAPEMITEIRPGEFAVAATLNALFEEKGISDRMCQVDERVDSHMTLPQYAILNPEQIEAIRQTGEWDPQVNYEFYENYPCLVVSKEVGKAILESDILTPTDDPAIFKFAADGMEDTDVYEAVVAGAKEPDKMLFQILCNGFSQY